MRGKTNKTMETYNQNFERDFNFYLKNKDTFTFDGKLQHKVISSPQGVPAKEAFYQRDTNGKVIPTSEPELLLQLLKCKGSVNFNIKMWAESFADWTLFEDEIDEYMQQYNCPKWVKEAVINQGRNIRQAV